MNFAFKVFGIALVVITVAAFINVYIQTVLLGGMFYTAPFNSAVVTGGLIVAVACGVYLLINIWKNN